MSKKLDRSKTVKFSHKEKTSKTMECEISIGKNLPNSNKAEEYLGRNPLSRRKNQQYLSSYAPLEPQNTDMHTTFFFAGRKTQYGQ